MKLAKTHPRQRKFKPVRFVYMGGVFRFDRRVDLEDWCRATEAKSSIEDPTEYGAIALFNGESVRTITTVEDVVSLRP